ncbi:hypothetical protein [Candidatus Ichthyocystis sparus]|uniref:hypothetical protein n=1 Tax=Candidatus Ichthyocystis sparus TaxID=1561004 RepID=UPI000B88795D|nr:hypothetical protein [Candidatus Ichthyocystis sparus]
MDNINADRGNRERENRVQQSSQDVTESESGIGVSSDSRSKASRSPSSYRGGASSSSRLNIHVGNMGSQDS